MRVLIGIPSPRDIPEFIDAMAWINDDKVWIKYYDEYTAYKYIRMFFLKHEEYTHLCIIPDDLIVKREQFNKLKEGIQDHFIFSGVCNTDYHRQDVLACRQNGKNLSATDQNGIQKVEFEGFSCCFIRRDVVEKIVLDGEGGFDNILAKECRELDIPMYVDTTVKLLHLAGRSGIAVLEHSGIGLRQPRIVYEHV